MLWLWFLAVMACPRAGGLHTVKAQHAPDVLPQNAADWKQPYPPEAKAKEIEGVVVLRVQIDEEGNVTDATVVKGLGFGLDEASVAALKRFKFKPATKDGVPVGTIITYRYAWYLE